MALTKCEVCGEQVSTEAPACPHCGGPGPAAPAESPGGDHHSPEPDSGTPDAGAIQGSGGAPVRGLGLLLVLAAGAIARYFGLGLLLLLAAAAGLAVLLGLALRPLTKPSSRPLLPAVALQFAQLVWIVAAGVYLGVARSMVPYAAVLFLGTLWLWLRPGALAVAVLSIYQGVAFLLQLLAYLALPAREASTAVLGGLVAMALVRLAAVILMITGLATARRQTAVRADLAVRLPDMLTWEEVKMLVDQARAGTLYHDWPSAQDQPPVLDPARWDAVLRDVDFSAAQRALRRVLAQGPGDAAQQPDQRLYPREYGLALARFLVEPSSTTAAPLLEASPSLQEVFEQSKPGGLWTH
jgi:hypothetical protein